MSGILLSIAGGMIAVLVLAILLAGGPWGIFAWVVSRPKIATWLISRAMLTPYTHIIGNDGSTYMERYWLFNPYRRGPDKQERSKYFWFPWNIRLHWIRRADTDEHMHDHPWNARTIILRGAYTEEREVVRITHPVTGKLLYEDQLTFMRSAGDTARLRFNEYHRITYVQPGGAWTLFISGPYKGTWGFLVDGVKIHWKTYLGLK